MPSISPLSDFKRQQHIRFMYCPMPRVRRPYAGDQTKDIRPSIRDFRGLGGCDFWIGFGFDRLIGSVILTRL